MAGNGWGATVYVDGLLGGTCAGGAGTSYRLTQRDCGGSDTTKGYATFNAARVATSDADTIIIRGDAANGTQLTYAGIDNQILKAYTIQKYSGDTHKPIITFNSGQDGFTFSANKNVAMSGIAITGGSSTKRALVWVNSGASSNTLEDVEIFSWLGKPMLHYAATTVFTNLYIHDCVERADLTGGTATFNYSIIYNNGDASVNNALIINGATVTTNNSIIWGSGIDSVGDALVKISSGAWTDNNGIIGGVYKTVSAYGIERSGGTLVLNNSLVNGSPWTPYTYTPITGTATANNTLQKYNPRWSNAGFGTAIFTFYAQDSNHSDGAVGSTSLEFYTTEFAKYSKHFTWFPDDTADFALIPNRVTVTNTFLAGGNDLGVQGRASSRLDLASPINIDYVGAGATPQVVVAVTDENTATIDLKVDGASIGAPFPIDISRGGAYKYVGVLATASSVAKTINDLADWVVAMGTVATPDTTSSYDDAFAYCLTAGTYDATNAVDIPWDTTRYMTEEITRSVADMEVIWPAITFKSYYFPRKIPSPTNANAFLATAGIEVGLSDDVITGSYLSSISDILDMRIDYLTPTIIRGTGYSDLSDVDKEARIRGFARNWAASALTYGLWNSLELFKVGDASALSAAEISWFVGQLISEGVQVLSFAEAVAYIKANWTDGGGGAYTKSTSTPNLALQYNSPAKNAGTLVTGVHDVAGVTDYAGNSVYNRGGIDIGCYEYMENQTLGTGPAFNLGTGAALTLN